VTAPTGETAGRGWDGATRAEVVSLPMNRPCGQNLLQMMHQVAALDPSPVRSGLTGVHVPFDVLTASTNYEAAAAAAVTSTARLAVIGPSGSGKTSFIGHVMDALAHTHGVGQGVAALRIPVDAEDPAVVTEPAAFAAHVVRTVARLASSQGRIPQRQARQHRMAAGAVTRARQRGASVTAGVPTWLAHGDLAAQLQSVTTSVHTPTGAELTELAATVVGTQTAAGLYPVLVIDDSDTWLAGTVADRSSNVAPFFGRVLPAVARDWNAGLVVAVHESYLTMPEYPRRDGWLNTEVRLPRLSGADAVGLLLAARASATTHQPAGVGDVAGPEGLANLHADYIAGPGSVRQMMSLAHTALTVALDGGSAQRLEGAHVAAARASL